MTLEKLIKELTLCAKDSKEIYTTLDDEQSFGEYVAYTHCLELLSKYRRKENL